MYTMKIVRFTVKAVYYSKPAVSMCSHYRYLLEKPMMMMIIIITIKVKAIPLQAWTGPEGFQEVEAARFQDNRHMKVVWLSA